MTKIEEKKYCTAEIFSISLLDQNLQFTYPSKKGAQATTLKREHPALKKIKFVNCFLFFWVFFTLLGPS
jgi:hypothetical protein